MALSENKSSLSPQPMAETGKITCFAQKRITTSFSGIAPGKNDSDNPNQKTVRTPQKDSPSL